MKFYKTLLIILIMILSSAVFAITINSEFKPSQDISHLKEGDLVEVTMRFWPIENADLAQFKKLEKSLLFNAFYLAQVLSLENSPNNADVIELKALLIVKSAKPQQIFVFKYNEVPIEMHFGDMKIEELQKKDFGYFILDQSMNGSNLMMILIVFFILLIVAGIYKRQMLKNYCMSLKPNALKKSKIKYDEIFRRASKREDFELIYQEKNNWLKLLESRAPAHNEFFRILNEFQYKKEWSNEDYNEVRSSFDIIRRSFEK